MRALFVSDLHANLRLQLAKVRPGAVGSDRLDDVISILKQVAEYAHQNGIVHIFVLGDMFDSRHPDGATLVAVSRVFSDMARSGLQLNLLPGNHDSVDRDGRLYTLDLYNELQVPGIHVLKHETIEVSPGLRIHAMPWLPEERAMRRLREIHEKNLDKSGRDILVFHQGVLGALGDGGWICDDGISAQALEQFDLALTGHFHKPQAHSWGRYLGSPMHLRFNDCDGSKRGFWDIQLDGHAIQPQLVEAKYPVFNSFDVEIPAGGLIENIFDITKSISGVSYVRLVVKGQAADISANKKTLLHWQQESSKFGLRSIKVDMRPEKQVLERLKLGNSLSLGEMAAKYAETFCTEDMDKVELSRIGREFVERAESKHSQE